MKKRTFTKKEWKALTAAAEEQQDKMRGGRLWRNLDFLVFILLTMLIAFGVRNFLFEPIRVDGDSMAPTLLDSEMMFVEKVSYWFAPPERGQVVICRYPGYTENCVKRVIGLPSERLRITDGTVYINDAPLNESDYWRDEIYSDMAELTVPAETVFVMGDNRNYSKDSRAHDVGPIPYAKIIGRVRFVTWPIEAIAAMGEVSY